MSGTYIIAELSANHNNDFGIAVKSVEAIAQTGANAVKVQTFTPKSLTLDADNEYFGPRIEGLWKGWRPWDLFKIASMPYEWQPKLKKIAEDLGMDFFSSPFDKEGVDFLESIYVPSYKVASLEISDLPLISYIAEKHKPMIISTGVADEQDIVECLHVCRNAGNNDITLLKCTSEYPATIEAANLSTIPDMIKRFGVRVGVSDHTMGSIVPVVAVSLGATVVEKHFILDRSKGGPDSAFSMEPSEFTAMVSAVRDAEKALGIVKYDVSEKDKKRRRSLFVVEDVKKGEQFTERNIRSIRPGAGLPPKHIDEIVGKVAANDIKKGTPLDWTLIA